MLINSLTLSGMLVIMKTCFLRSKERIELSTTIPYTYSATAP